MQSIEHNSADSPAAPLADKTDRTPQRFTTGLAIGLLATSLVFRFLWLDRLPGINGDEAWYGVQIQNMLAGEEWSGRTPTKLPINPLLFGTETLLLLVREPSFWILRLPVAVWCCAGLALTFWLHRRVFRDTSEALVVATLTACLPTHLAYSRFCWDSSFSFFSVPLALYGVLATHAGGRAAWRRFVWLVIPGCTLTVWNHATHAVFVLACLLVVAWEFARPFGPFAKRRPITCSVVAIFASYVLVQLLKSFYEGRQIWRSMTGALDRLDRHLVALGDIIVGPRAYDYLAGVPRSEWLTWLYVLLLPAFFAAAWMMLRRGAEPDRRLAVLSAFTFVLVLLVGRRVEFNELSYERYVLYVVPLAAVVFVRGLRACAVRWPRFGSRRVALTSLVVSVLLLFQFWFAYFEPLRQQTHRDRLHRTFWTSVVAEPKAELAAAIRARSHIATTLYVEDWWVRWPVGYLLGTSVRVIDRFEVEDIKGPCLISEFAGSEVLRRIEADHRLRPATAETLRIGGPPGEPRLGLFVLGPTDARSGGRDSNRMNTIDGPP